MSTDTSLGLRLHRYVWQKVIILRVIQLWTEELNTCTIKYTAGELLMLQPTQVTIPWTTRKSIFGFILWLPRKQRAQRNEGVSSRDVLPRTDTVDHSQSREHMAVSTVGRRNAVSNLSIVWIYTRYWTSTTTLSNCVVMGSARHQVTWARLRNALEVDDATQSSVLSLISSAPATPVIVNCWCGRDSV